MPGSSEVVIVGADGLGGGIDATARLVLPSIRTVDGFAWATVGTAS